MAIKITVSGILNFDETVNHHAKLGWQCPECYGIQIKSLYDRFYCETKPIEYQCDECGNIWATGE